MRSEADVRGMLQEELDRPGPVEVAGPREDVRRRVRKARRLQKAVRGGVAAAVVSTLGSVASWVSSNSEDTIKAGPAEPSGEMAASRRRVCTSQMTLVLHTAQDADRIWELFVNEKNELVLRFLLDDGSCGGDVVGGKAALAPGRAIDRGAGGGDPTGANYVVMFGAVAKEATEVVVLFRTGEERVVPVVPGGPAAPNVYVVFPAEDSGPLPVAHDAVARLTASNAEGEVGRLDISTPLACGTDERGEWDARRPLLSDPLVSASNEKRAVEETVERYFDRTPHDTIQSAGRATFGETHVLRKGALVGSFTVVRGEDDRKVYAVLRCVPR